MNFVFIWDAHINTCLLICDVISVIQAASPKLIVVPGASSWLLSAPESSQVHRILSHHYTVRTDTAASQPASCPCSAIGKWAVVSVKHFALIQSLCIILRVRLLPNAYTFLCIVLRVRLLPNAYTFLCIVLRVRLLPNAYTFFIELKCFNSW